MRFDHAVIAVNDLDKAVADYQKLGFNPVYGGVHANGTTHNALIYFRDGSYLELLAPTGNASKDDADAVDFSGLVAGGEGLVGYALTSDDLEARVETMRKRGLTVQDVSEGGRKRKDGVELRWKSAGLPDSMSPFFIEDITPRNLRVLDNDSAAHANGVTGVEALYLTVDDDLIDRYEKIFDIKIDGDEYDHWMENTRLQMIRPLDAESWEAFRAQGDAPRSLLLRTIKPLPTPMDITLTHGVNIGLMHA